MQRRACKWFGRSRMEIEIWYTLSIPFWYTTWQWMWANNINICSSINESEIFAFLLFNTACSGDKDGSKCNFTGGHYLFEEGSKHWVQDQRYSAQVSETLSTSIGFSQGWGAHIHTVALPLRGDAENILLIKQCFLLATKMIQEQVSKVVSENESIEGFCSSC